MVWERGRAGEEGRGSEMEGGEGKRERASVKQSVKEKEERRAFAMINRCKWGREAGPE